MFRNDPKPGTGFCCSTHPKALKEECDDMRDPIEIEDLEMLGETPMAVHVTDGKVNVWLPWSQIEVENNAENDLVAVTMPEWLAIDKGLV